jgi:hypothetical protein
MTDDGATSTETSTFLDAVTGLRRIKVDLTDLLQLWAVTVPRLVSSPQSTAALRDALDELAAAGSIELPAGSWDTASTPPLPKFVRVPSARTTKRPKAHLSHPWRPELGWVASLRTVTDGQFEALQRINRWLAGAHTAPVVPHRIRSAEILGDEKALDTLSKSVLFGAGRLSFDLLRCDRIPPPLPAAAVGDGPDVLIVENSDPYWYAVEQLRGHPGHPIGAVIWGSGDTFPAQVSALGVDVAGRGPVTGTAWYWGDLDPKGVRIAVDAARLAAVHGVAPVRVPVELWAAHLGVPVTSPGAYQWDETGAAWFGDELWAALEPVRAAGGRVSQEACTPAAITSWLESGP